MAAGKNELKQRASRAIVLHAFFRLESALVIAMTLILIAFLPRPFPWWQWWYWLVFGLVSEALVLYTSITDERTNRRLVENLLRQEFNPSEISSAEYRQRVEKALEYRQQIEEHVSGIRAGVLRGHLLETTAGVADWVESVFGLAKRLDRYHSDRTLVRDRREVPREIVGLRARLDREDDEAVRKQLEQAIARKQEQLSNLEKLQNMMEKAQYQLETTLTALGTVYSQLQLISAKDIDSGRAQRLRQDIEDQIAALQSVQSTLDEVYSSRI